LNNSGLSLEAQVRRVEKVLDQTRLDVLLLNAIEANAKRPGRPREISVRAFLVALIVLGLDGREHLIRVVRLLNSLDEKTLVRLGVSRKEPITRRQVENLNRVVMASLEAKAASEGVSKWEILDELADLLLPATAHPDVKKTTSIAVDGTVVASWGTRRKRKVVNAKGKTVFKQIPTDQDAHWRGRSADSWKRPVFGYDLTGAVSVPELGGEDVPLAMLSMRFRPATKDTTQMALACVSAVAKWQGGLGDVLMDREYTKRDDAGDFLMPIRALGGEPVFDLMPNQLGADGTVRGALIIDGQPFSPSLPKALHMIEVPKVGCTSEERMTYQRSIAARSIYALKAHGSRKSDGQQTYMCPAAAGQVTCPLMAPKRPVKRGALPVYYLPASVAPKSICANAYTTFGALDLPLDQRDLYGSKEWFFSYSRRNRVEGFFGNVKNEASENLRRGAIRVRGGLKTGFLTLMILAATNLRLAERWEVNGAKPTKKRRGRPRRQTLTAYAEVALQAGRSNAPPSQA
jgi:hypothetical protein